MPNDFVNQVLNKATAALNHANKAFPQSKPPAHVGVGTNPAPAPKPAPAPSGLAAELRVKSDNVNQYANAPKMHTGGPVRKTGVYRLKKGEHVLTEDEAKKARRHALMAAGVGSLGKVIPTPPQRTAAVVSESGPKAGVLNKKPEKKTISGIETRPKKTQTASNKLPVTR